MINHAVREDRGWFDEFDEPDELERAACALTTIDGLDDPVDAASVVDFRVARAQGLAEDSKRTALLLGSAESGSDVAAEIVALLSERFRSR
ncbi:MAG: hypothetical protein ACYCU6_11220 [Acidimicrobiales bacterium]